MTDDGGDWHWVFVYGTLRRDAGHPMHGVLARGSEYGGTARARGRLVVVEWWYPGLVHDETAGFVAGELWRRSRAADWRSLDAHEGCGEDDPEPYPFVRREIEVERDDGTRLVAIAYVFVGEAEMLEEIASGDWLAHLERVTDRELRASAE